jgi:hypothetical protein
MQIDCDAGRRLTADQGHSASTYVAAVRDAVEAAALRIRVGAVPDVSVGSAIDAVMTRLAMPTTLQGVRAAVGLLLNRTAIYEASSLHTLSLRMTYVCCYVFASLSTALIVLTVDNSGLRTNQAATKDVWFLDGYDMQWVSTYFTSFFALFIQL